MQMIECETFYGGTKLIPKDKLFFRPSVYALLIHHGKLLLLNTRYTGKYFLPGGAVELGERLEDALKREVREEAGLEITLERLYYFREMFFYHDPDDYAFHGLFFVYLCRPETLELIDDAKVDDGISEKPRWIDMNGLQAEEFQSFAQEVFVRLQKDRLGAYSERRM